MKEEILNRNTDELEFVHIKSFDMLRINKKEFFYPVYILVIE
jgi:hypothetical protein